MKWLAAESPHGRVGERGAHELASLLIGARPEESGRRLRRAEPEMKEQRLPIARRSLRQERMRLGLSRQVALDQAGDEQVLEAPAGQLAQFEKLHRPAARA